MGADFPSHLKQLISTWHTDCIFRLDTTRLTTTAWNGYGKNEYRAFRYLTPKLRLEKTDLSDEQALAKSFHMVCSPARCMSLVEGILSRRRNLLRGRNLDPDEAGNERSPIFVWEPVPDLCSPEELNRLREAAGCVNVVSPNAEEFASFFREVPGYDSRESQVEWLFRMKRSQNGDNERPLKTMLVIREGAHGCSTYTALKNEGLHLRAHHQSKEKVVDPTGGGNTFLGALAVGLTGITTADDTSLCDSDISAEQRRLLLGLVHATVAAGYAIEQTGMPNVSATDGDIWNGERYSDRFIEYLEREREYIARQLSTSNDEH